ncbi:hypothetical protein BH09VER1_BH09VER1_01310 [soil metagenome]
MTTEEKPAPPKQKRSFVRRWLRRIGLTLLVLLALLIAFHRPIFFEATRYFVVRAAKQQKLEISYEMSGSIFTTLSVANLKATPTEPGPIKRLEIGTVNLQYSLWDLARRGLPAFLRMVELKNVYVELTPGEPLPPAKDAQPQQFKFPALFPKVLNIENVNFISHAPTGDTVLEGLYFSLLPDKPGMLKVKTLDIPGVRRWEGISAATTFRDRNLKLTDLVIGPEIALKIFNLDASKLEENKLGVALEGAFFGAQTEMSLQVEDLNATNKLALKLDCEGLVFEKMTEYLNLNVPIHGTLTKVAVVFSGLPETPESWVGELSTTTEGLKYGQQTIGKLDVYAKLKDKKATLSLGDALDAKNAIGLTVEAELPEKLAGFSETTASGKLVVTAPDLTLATLSLPQPVDGSATVEANFSLKDSLAVVDAKIMAPEVATAGAVLKDAGFTLHVEKEMKGDPHAPVFQGVTTRVEGGVGSVKFQDYVTDAIGLIVSTKGAEVKVEQLSLKKAANELQLSATYTLPEDMQSFTKQPLTADLALNAADLQAFVAPGSDVNLKGTLKVSGKARAQDGVYNADLEIAGRDIEAAGLTVRTVDGLLSVADNKAKLSQLDVVMNDKNTIHSEGEVQLADPFAYTGKVDVKLDDLAFFQPLLPKDAKTKKAPELGGALRVTWQGTGDAAALKHNGAATIDLTKGQYGDQKDLMVHVAADYAPDYINVPDVRAVAGQLGSTELSMFWKDKRLAISQLAVRQQKLTVLEGSASVPLDLAQYRKPALILPEDQPIEAALKTVNLDLATLFKQLGQPKPPVLGTVNFTFSATGTLDTLAADASLQATRLRSPDAAKIDPAEVSLNLRLRDDRLALDGSVRQRLIQPLQIKGNIPMDLEAIKKKGAIDPDTPVELEVRLPRSSMDFLSTVVPAIRLSRGHADIDVKVAGTIAKPSLAGNIDADLSSLRFTDPSLPPLNNFTLRIGFTENRLNILNCRGGVAGGWFGAAGNVNFARLDNPVLNLQVGARNALVLQNDDMTARVSADLRITGPLNAGSVTGSVFVTRSRFFKNVDILPIGLPGRPAPQPPPEPTVISFPKPPLRDWKFDITIKTLDPFLVESNLARGKIVMDLRLGGTGLNPWMDGNVTIENLTASLPFSRLQIASGQIFFEKDQPFSPQLEIRGTSDIRDYRVQVYIYGPASDPTAIFSSNPPLPQAEVVSLLATGMTTRELAGDPNALAGRAAMLLLQKLYRTVFKKSGNVENDSSFLSKVQLDLGATDPKTGKQSAGVRVPLSDRFTLIGGVDVGGNFRGQLRYIMRFK